MAFLKLVQVSISDDLVRLEDELFDKSVTIHNSGRGLDDSSPLVTYQGKMDKADLSLIREKSATQEESVILSQRFDNAESRHSDTDMNQSVLFGQDHPFKIMRQGCDDMFTVSARPLTS